MRRYSLPLIAVASLGLITSVASAADLPHKAPVAVPPAPPPFSWTGFYIGAHGGAGWGTVESSITSVTPAIGLTGSFPLASHGVNGWLFGATVGYNWQVNPWLVVGVEGDWTWSNIEGTAPCLVVVSCKTEVKWTADLTGRVGFAVDRALVYVKGGVVWADTDYSAFTSILGTAISTSASDTRVGGLFGAGVEYAFQPNWSAKVEYNYMDFGHSNQTFALNAAGTPVTLGTEINQQIHVIKAGVNYRFSSWR